MMRKRTLVIGDVHGMYDELMRALEKSGFGGGDRLIFLGDYINRGPKSREVMDFLTALAREPGHVFLCGNHEQIILQMLAGNADYWYMWLEYSRGRETLQSYGIDPGCIVFKEEFYVLRDGSDELPLDSRQNTTAFIRRAFPPDHLTFLQDTVASFETEDFFFSHAGLQKEVPLSGQSLYTDCFLIWGDTDFLADELDYGKSIVFGHYHLQEPFMRRQRLGIALEGAVAVLDLDNQVIIDSQGRVFKLR